MQKRLDSSLPPLHFRYVVTFISLIRNLGHFPGLLTPMLYLLHQLFVSSINSTYGPLELRRQMTGAPRSFWGSPLPAPDLGLHWNPLPTTPFLSPRLQRPLVPSVRPMWGLVQCWDQLLVNPRPTALHGPAGSDCPTPVGHVDGSTFSNTVLYQSKAPVRLKQTAFSKRVLIIQRCSFQNGRVIWSFLLFHFLGG